MQAFLAIVLLTASPFAVAEVWGNVPREVDFIVFGLIGATIAYLSASRKWWLGMVGLALTLIAIGVARDLLELREALWRERGMLYFIAMAVTVIGLVVATIAGVFRGWQRAKMLEEVAKSRALIP